METSLKVKPERGRKTKVKNRTSDRPVLRSKKKNVFEKHFIPHNYFKVGYGLAVLILFQFISIPLALGLLRNPIPQAHARMIAAVPAVKPKVDVKAAKGLPVRIKIPTIRVNALVRYVGLLSDGSMGVPKLPRDAAWYMLGPKPGEKGSAVIAGHVNWWSGATGVFEHLKTLKPGDKITVQDDQGKTISFVVRTIREYGQKEDASDVFFSNDGKAHLNLVTCAGVWDTLTKAYAKRLVVFTDKVE